MLFRTKICGVTRRADALAAARAGAGAIGLNFHPSSPRCVTADTARQLGADLPGKPLRVGVFVDLSADEINAVCDSADLDLVQLHGEEPADLAGELRGRGVIRAFRCREQAWEPVLDHLDEMNRCGTLPQAILLDAYDPAVHGGSGRRLDWDWVSQVVRRVAPLPVVVAGGLTPGNVAEAIFRTHAHAVDVASGVEDSPGNKNARQIQQFVSRAERAFAERRGGGGLQEKGG